MKYYTFVRDAVSDIERRYGLRDAKISVQDIMHVQSR